MKNNNLQKCGISHNKKHKRAELDYYATPPKAAQLLLDNEKFDNKIWECCSGGNHIVDVLVGNGYNVRASDVVKKMTNTEVFDFLSEDNNEIWEGDIITNPPFQLKDENGKEYANAETFIRKALSLVKDGHKVAMYLRDGFISSRKRNSFYDEFPPYEILYPNTVLSCAKDGDFEHNKNGILRFAWFVWIKGYKGNMIIKRIKVEDVKEIKSAAIGQPNAETFETNDENKICTDDMRKGKVSITQQPTTFTKKDFNSMDGIVDDDGDDICVETDTKQLSDTDVSQVLKRLKQKRHLDYRANDIMELGATMKDVQPLFSPFFYENEISVLFAESNLGKSILAVQIGEHIAREGKKVYYFDYELSTKQFQERYTNVKDRTMYRFSDNFYRPILDYELNQDQDTLLDRFYETIEKKAKEGVEVFIVDNITYLSDRSYDKSFIINFLKNLKSFKNKHKVSFLIIAHTPKRKANKPLEQSDLAGSKAFMNFIDSAFAIGRSITDSSILYVKQIKVRVGKFVYKEDNVLKCQIVKEGNFVHFKDIGTEAENHLLDKKYLMRGENEKLMSDAWDMHLEGKSNRAIARELSVTDKTIAKWICKMEESKSYVNEMAFAVA